MKNSRKTEVKQLREMIDIKNAEKFFDRTGKEIKECYDYYSVEIIDGNPDDTTGSEDIFLYIPEAENDIYTIYLN